MADELRMALAEVLRKAGCEDERIQSHCASDSAHYRGCWVVDGILGLGDGVRE